MGRVEVGLDLLQIWTLSWLPARQELSPWGGDRKVGQRVRAGGAPF